MSVLLCDDHKMFLTSLAAALRVRQHDVPGICTSPDELLAQASVTKPAAFLMETQYAGVRRLDVLPCLRAVCPDARIVLMTASAGPEEWHAYSAGLADALISKATTLSQFDLALRRVLAGERVVLGVKREQSSDLGWNGVEPLTAREHEVLQLVVAGISTSMMAVALEVSPHTVRSHVQSLLRKLQVHGRGRAAHRAVELGLVDRSLVGVPRLAGS